MVSYRLGDLLSESYESAIRMITIFDYRPSQNAWKVRQFLGHLRVPYQWESTSASGNRRRGVTRVPADRWAPVPMVLPEVGRVLSEFNTIIWSLSSNTEYRTEDPSRRRRSFNGCHSMQNKRATANRALNILNRLLATQLFIAADAYSIADIAIFAYAHLAADAGISTSHLPDFEAWIERVRARQNFVAPTHPLC